MKCVCAWCGGLIRDGDESKPISHGICPACFTIVDGQAEEDVSSDGYSKQGSDSVRGENEVDARTRAA